MAPLRERGFRLLFLGLTVSRLGRMFTTVALAFAVLEIGGDATDLGLVLAGASVAQAVLSLAGGVWADRLPRHWVMVAASVLQGASQLAFAALLVGGSARIWHAAAFSILMGVASAFFWPASQGIVPQVVSPPHLQEANALLRFSFNITGIGGAALGGVLVASAGAGVPIALGAVAFLACALLFATITVSRSADVAARFIDDLRGGWEAFRSRAWVWTIVLQAAVLNAFWFGGMSVLGPIVATRHLGGAGPWGLVLAAEAFGLACGAVIALRLRPERPLRAAMLAVSCAALPLLALAVSAPLALVAIAAFVSGIGIEICGVYWVLTLQQQIPTALLSRVTSYDMLGSIALAPLGYIFVGPLADAAGSSGALWICGAAVAGLAFAPLLVRDVRELRRTDRGEIGDVAAVRATS